VKHGPLAICYGTRPQVIKASMLIEAGAKHWPLVTVDTGQHYDYNMSDSFFRDLKLPEPDFHLEVGSGSHAEQTGRVMIEYEKIAERERPDRRRLDVEREPVEALAGRAPEVDRGARLAFVLLEVHELRQIPRDDLEPRRVRRVDKASRLLRVEDARHVAVVAGLEVEGADAVPGHFGDGRFGICPLRGVDVDPGAETRERAAMAGGCRAAGRSRREQSEQNGRSYEQTCRRATHG